jgi:hypothetical protein
MPETAQTLHNLVNAAGFLFQLRVEQEIMDASKAHQGMWANAAREHRWVNPSSQEEGFIDLVVRSGFCRIVIECKRVTDANWVFLVEADSQPLTRARLLWTYLKTQQSFTDWHDFHPSPPTLEAAFCIVRGHSDNNNPMMERIASTLQLATESLAAEELTFDPHPESSNPTVYLPIVVTNATLQVCRFHSRDIDLATGDLPVDAVFEETPYIRFRKNLSTSLSPNLLKTDLERANFANERTIIVLNAAYIREFLPLLGFPYNSLMGGWPWEGLD